LLQHTVRVLFAEAVRRMVAAFEVRATKLYGRPSAGQRRQHRKCGEDRDAADAVAIAREDVTLGAPARGRRASHQNEPARLASRPCRRPGPATPVTETAMSALERDSAPAAIARATGSLTAPWPRIASHGTPSISRLASLE